VDLEKITAWWTDCPAANVAIPMGAASRLLLLDLDYRGKSVVAERSDVIRLFGPIPETAEVITGSGSRHIYFRFAGGKVGHRRGCSMIFWQGGKFAGAQRHASVEDVLDSLDTILEDPPDEITVPE
jgi:hypothetical protein